MGLIWVNLRRRQWGLFFPFMAASICTSPKRVGFRESRKLASLRWAADLAAAF